MLPVFPFWTGVVVHVDAVPSARSAGNVISGIALLAFLSLFTVIGISVLLGVSLRRLLKSLHDSCFLEFLDCGSVLNSRIKISGIAMLAFPSTFMFLSADSS